MNTRRKPDSTPIRTQRPRPGLRTAYQQKLQAELARVLALLEVRS